MDKSIIGKRVRRHREALSLTREGFAEKVGISSQFLAEIENGTKGMSAETLCKICEHGEASADYLLFGQIKTNALSPAAKMLNEIPQQYSTLLEDVIRSFRETIKLANEPKKRSSRN